MKQHKKECPLHILCTQTLAALLVVAFALLAVYSDPIMGYFASLVEVGSDEFVRAGLGGR